MADEFGVVSFVDSFLLAKYEFIDRLELELFEPFN